MQENAQNSLPIIKGRGTALNPENRFEPLRLEADPEWLERERLTSVETHYFVDTTKDILAKNDSPDVSFDFSINPYRGCEHGCIYCYARPTHEYFGWSSGLDFETRILVKKDAPHLMEQKFRSRSWQPQVVALCGNTDCYQPIERQLQLTRRCLEVFLRFRNPVSIITKNALILRDLDLLQKLAERHLVRVTLSVTTLDHSLARKMEPRTSAPVRRLEALEKLTQAGIPTNVNIAPVIPGLTDHEMPAILKEAAARGVKSAAYILMRLPYSVKELFANWLQHNYPERMNKVLNTVRDTRAGRLNDPCFSSRQKGEGARAAAIARLFEVTCEKYGFNKDKAELSVEHFRRDGGLQRDLFGP